MQRLDRLALEMSFRQGLERIKSIADLRREAGAPLSLKLPWNLGGFSQRQPQLIMFSGKVRVDLVSMPKFTQQIRCYTVDTAIDKDRFKEVKVCLQMEPAKQNRQTQQHDP